MNISQQCKDEMRIQYGIMKDAVLANNLGISELILHKTAKHIGLEKEEKVPYGGWMIIRNSQGYEIDRKRFNRKSQRKDLYNDRSTIFRNNINNGEYIISYLLD